MAVVAQSSLATDELKPGTSNQTGNHLASGRGANLVAIIGLCGAASLYFWFVHAYGVNTIFYDQWENVALLTHSNFFLHSFTGQMSLGHLWVQHNENRMLFPNLVVLALGATTNLNVLVELYLSAILASLAVVLVILAHRRALPSTPWLYYCPLAFLMLTFGQQGDSLVGFQMAWYLVLFALAAALYLLDRRPLSWIPFAVAVCAAVVGSYSSLQGLLIWPAGLVILWWKRRPRSFVAIWLAAAALTTAVYFFHFDTSSTASDNGYLFSHPLSAFKFFFFAVGNVMGRPLGQGSRADDPSIVALGVLIVAVAVVCLAIYGRCERSASPVGPSLICFGLLFVATITLGRAHLGLTVASQSRYVTFDLLILAGCYLCLIEWWPQRRDLRRDPPRLRALALNLVDHPPATVRRRWRELTVIGLRSLVVVVVAGEILLGVDSGVSGARGWHSGQELAALVTAHADQAPNSLITTALFPNRFVDDDNIRHLAQRAKQDRLSLFSTGEAAALEARRLPRSAGYSPPRTQVSRPGPGAELRGGVVVDARAVSDDYPLSRVEFRVLGPDGSVVTVVRGTRTLFGWLAEWRTTDVTDGIYSLQSVAFDVSGGSGVSAPVLVRVMN